MTAARNSALRTGMVGVWQRNLDLLRNAGSLAATTGLTSMFGLVFWIVAAKEFSQQEVGYGSAAISAMTLLGTVGMLGLGTVLIGELPQRHERGGLMAAALMTSALGSLMLGLAFPLIALAFGTHLPEITGTPTRLAVFAIGVALTGASLVFDEGTIGLMRGGVQLTRNFAMSVFKLLVLPITALVLHDGFGMGIVLAWILGTIFSLLTAAAMLAHGGSRVLHSPDWWLLRRLSKVAAAHNWLNLAIAIPPKLIPVLVTVVVSPSANAAFYVAWMLVSFLFMVPISLSTVLFAIASASPEVIAEKLRFVLRVSLAIGLPAMAILAICAHFALSIFGPSYAHLGTVPLWFLIIGYIPGIPKTQYIAVCRATRKVTKAATVLTAAMCCELAAVVLGGRAGGLSGLALAYLGVTTLEGLVTAPTVLRAARARIAVSTGAQPTTPAPVGITSPLALATIVSASVMESHSLDVATEVWRTGGFPAVPSHDQGRGDAAEDLAPTHPLGAQRTDVPPESRSYRYRQQAGLDALIALATAVNPQDNSPNLPSTERSRRSRKED